MIEAIAWDIDGTLVDSEPLHHHALLTASLRWQADLSDLGQETFRGLHLHDVWAMLAGRLPKNLEQREWLAAIADTYDAGAAALKPLAGALETMQACASRGLRQVCVSNSYRRVVEANLRALGITDLVEFSISFEDVTRGKPDPEPYRLACERLRLAPGAVLAVEDSEPGARSARAAGLAVAFYAPGPPATPESVEADLTIRRYDDLTAWLDRIRGPAR